MKDSSLHNKPRILTQEEAAIERQNMTYEQRFDLLMKLIRLQKMMKGVKNNPNNIQAIKSKPERLKLL